MQFDRLINSINNSDLIISDLKINTQCIISSIFVIELLMEWNMNRILTRVPCIFNVKAMKEFMELYTFPDYFDVNSKYILRNLSFN